MYLDDRSPLTVDNASRMSAAQVSTLVLAADRSTQSGCPYYKATKGLIKGGANADRVFVSDYYLAWFDYTLNDGVGTHQFSRSGTLAGYWSLNPNTQGFKYYLEPYSPARETPNAEGTCWNWARNELLPGSNSPKAQLYWWDRYAPPLENTLVFQTPTSVSSGAYGSINLFSTVYTQGTTGANFAKGSDGWQDSLAVHYTTAGTLSSWRGDKTFTAANPKNTSEISTGTIEYVLDFVCKEKEIQVVWLFKSSTTVTPINYYANAWNAHSGLGPITTCDSSGASVPARVIGTPMANGTPYHSYNFGKSSVDLARIDQLGRLTWFSPNTITTFPWTEAKPCNGVNVGLITKKFVSGLPNGSTLEVGFNSTLNNSQPYMKIINRISPTQGTGSAADPKALPFQQMVANYENNDQQQGLILMSYNSGQTLQGGVWYLSSYSVTTQK